MSALGIAAANRDRPRVAGADDRRPVGAAAMEHREFDYDGLVKPMESRMMRSIWRIVRQKEAAEDALQNALAVIWRKRETVARHPNPQALILKISIASANDAVRKSRRRSRYEIRTPPPAPSAAPVTEEAEERSLREAILEAVGSLSKRQATAVLLHLVEEQSYEEVARAMGCSETTVRIHIMRARAALARRLEHYRPGHAAASLGTGKEESS
jgi:RNA polymerase sigma-70 factor (ECF subfamily)